MSRETIHSAPFLLVPPDRLVLPVTLEEALDEIGNDDPAIHGRVRRFIRQAVSQVETDARQYIMTQTWQQKWDCFPCGHLELRKCPVQSITHVKYLSGGVLTMLSPSLYQTDLVSQPARILPIYGGIWPHHDHSMNAVEVQWVAGYATAAAVPDYVKSVILAIVRGLFYGCDLGDSYGPLIERMQRFGVVS